MARSNYGGQIFMAPRRAKSVLVLEPLTGSVREFGSKISGYEGAMNPGGKEVLLKKIQNRNKAVAAPSTSPVYNLRENVLSTMAALRLFYSACRSPLT